MTPKEIIQFTFRLARDGELDQLTQTIATMDEEMFGEIARFLIKKGIAPIIYDRITNYGYDRILPSGFVEILRKAFLHNAARNIFAKAQLTEIFNHLELVNVPVIVLKGAHFSFSIYEKPACRTMGDLDLLFHGNFVEVSVKTLESLGYQMTGPSWEGPQHHFPPMKKEGYPFPIEVHSTLSTQAGTSILTPDLIWETSEAVTLCGYPVRVLSPTLALFYVCLHAAYQHLFINTAQAIFDIEMLLQHHRQTIDWDAFWNYAETNNVVPGVAFLLDLGRSLLNIQFSDKVREIISSIKFSDEFEDAVFEVMAFGEQVPDLPPRELFNVVKWWLAKAGKFSNSISQANEKQFIGSQTSKKQAFSSFRRIGYLMKDYFSALANLLKTNRKVEKENASLLIRRWLKIP